MNIIEVLKGLKIQPTATATYRRPTRRASKFFRLAFPRIYTRETRAGSAHRDDRLTAATFSVRDLVLKIATHVKEMDQAPI